MASSSLCKSYGITSWRRGSSSKLSVAPNSLKLLDTKWWFHRQLIISIMITWYRYKLVMELIELGRQGTIIITKDLYEFCKSFMLFIAYWYFLRSHTLTLQHIHQFIRTILTGRQKVILLVGIEIQILYSEVVGSFDHISVSNWTSFDTFCPECPEYVDACHRTLYKTNLFTTSMRTKLEW